ncbi:MAG: serine hydrolase domain-containing protein [Bacteroidota bacterium]
MKNIFNCAGILLLDLLLISTSSLAQVKRHTYNSAAAQVQVYFNTQQPEKIYGMTSDIFRQKMTAQQFATGMNKFAVQTGKWVNFAFAAENEKGIDYTAVFENSTQLFSIKLDSMGKISRLNFALVPVIIATKNYRVPSNNLLKDSLDRLVEQLVRPYIQKGNTSGLVLAIIDKEKIRRYSYGTTDKTVQALPDASTTIFEIGSITKTFNSLVLAKEVIAGRMKLNDPINKYLPNTIPMLNFQGHPITLEQLANHTSGFPRLPENIFLGKINSQDPYKHYVADSLYSYLKHYRPSVIPGSKFSYSNFGAGVLSTILERTKKKTFEQLIVSEICIPLGMKNTTVTLNDSQQKNFAQGYNEKGKATAPWDLASLKGSGAIRSTLNDMVIYARAQMGMENRLNKAIDLSHQATFDGKSESMGLGWRINTTAKHQHLHHSGGTGGFRSFVGFDLNRQLAVVILSNAAEDVTAIGEYILSR